jgi:hypothetical protein
MVITEDRSDAPRVGVPVTVYVIVLLASIWIYKAYRPAGVLLALDILAPLAAFGWMVVRCREARRATGPISSATKAYMWRFFPLMIAYGVLLVAANWLATHYTLSGPTAVLVALLPAAPLIGVIVTMGRLVIEEKDEYQRLLHVRQMLVATGFMLAVSCVWGFLEEFGQVPHLPAYWAFILWCGGLGIGSIYNEVRP